MANWRHTREYRIWHATVIRRDKVCQVCGSRKRRNVHHLNSASYFPDERYDPENGICLCYICHYHFHILYKQGYRKKCTEKDFYRFNEIIKFYKRMYDEKDNGNNVT